MTGISIGQPPFLSVMSLELARADAHEGAREDEHHDPVPGRHRQDGEVGETVFPSLPDSFFADFTDSGPKATVVLCVQAALTGKPCPGTLTFASVSSRRAHGGRPRDSRRPSRAP